jgi:DNA repair exonuclease SbcCD ATPase subunit
LVQSILFFVLGFLCAGFLTVLVAPAVWRRAVALTRKRIEATIPLTLAEIQADKDRIRAEFAVAVRKLEVEAKSLKERLTAQLVELNRSKESLKALAEEGERKSVSLAELQAAKEQVEAALAEREGQLSALAEQVGEMEQAKAKHVEEFEKLGRMYDEASFSSSNRQIELVAREAELEKLASEITALRTQRKETDRRSAEAAAESRLSRDALKAEQKKTAEAEKKLERLTAALADREDKLERREKELARMREPASNGIVAHPPLPDGERERLEARLTALLRENKRLKADLAEVAAGRPAANGSTALREEMHNLAAEVVSLAIKLDEPGSPIAKALATPARSQGGGRMLSLADRVRALKEGAREG